MDFSFEHFSRPSVIVLLLSNLVPLIGVLFLGWSQGLLLLFYWMESAVIGLFTVFKMLGIGVPRSKEATEGKGPGWFELVFDLFGKVFGIGFFIFHYGIFMFVHLMFLVFFLGDAPDWNSIAWSLSIGLLSMLISHGLSYKWNYLDGGEYRKSNENSLMTAPYARIFLMQFAIIFGFMINAPAVILVVGKTLIDLVSHLFEHGQLRFPVGVRAGES